jgi:spermidine synthase
MFPFHYLKTNKDLELLFTHSTQKYLLVQIDEIQVYECKPFRWLTIGQQQVIHSVINIERPNLLMPQLYRAMLMPILFMKQPQRIVEVGMGGGTIGRFLQHHIFDIAVEAVEISTSVTTLARQYFDLANRPVHIEDARDFIKNEQNNYDWLIVDIIEGLSTAQWVTSPEFVHGCFERLHPGGILSLNLLLHPVNVNKFTKALQTIRKCFNQQTLCLNLPDCNNILIFAFKAPIYQRKLEEIKEKIIDLEKQWSTEFSTFFEQLLVDNPVSSSFNFFNAY